MKDTNVKIRKTSSFFRKKKTSHGRKGRVAPWLLFTAFALLATAILIFEMPLPLISREFKIGEPAPRTFFSPVNLNYINESATKEIRAKAVREVLPIFILRDEKLVLFEARFHLFFGILKSAEETKRSAGEITLLFPVSHAAIDFLLKGNRYREASGPTRLFCENVLNNGFMDHDEKSGLLKQGVRQIAVQKNDGKRSFADVSLLLTPLELSQAFDKAFPPQITRNQTYKAALLEVIQAVLTPNLFFDRTATEDQKARAASSVEPIRESVKKEELIVQRGVLMTPAGMGKLFEIEKKMAKHRTLSKLGALGLLAAVMTFFCAVFLRIFDKKIFFSPKILSLILIVFIFQLLICKGVILWPGGSVYLMPSALAAVLLTLFVDARMGFLSAMMMSVLGASLAQFSTDIILMTLLASVSGTFAARKLHKRLHFLKLGFFSASASFFAVFIFHLFQESSLLECLKPAGLAFGGGFVTMGISFLLLPVLEWSFGLTTDISLLELSDLNHPLLKRMIVEAPGTYHHSLVVSTLAESACQAIGANTLLARVGCYFHDIGKIARAEFFTENNRDSAHRHERLTSTMSCLIIMNHVKDGIELGRKYKLKDRILQFIPEHQGTGVIYYFYRKAMEQAKLTGGIVNPEDFRYPGPKPQSRETAVALLADSVEAASRSLRDPSPESIRQLVRKIINDKFIDGQLDECTLTLKDVHKIQESFIYNLMAIFHTRVKYPASLSGKEGKPDLFEKTPSAPVLPGSSSQ